MPTPIQPERAVGPEHPGHWSKRNQRLKMADLEHAVIEAAVEFAANEKKVRAQEAHQGTRLPLWNKLEDTVDALIEAREKQ